FLDSIENKTSNISKGKSLDVHHTATTNILSNTHIHEQLKSFLDSIENKVIEKHINKTTNRKINTLLAKTFDNLLSHHLITRELTTLNISYKNSDIETIRKDIKELKEQQNIMERQKTKKVETVSYPGIAPTITDAKHQAIPNNAQQKPVRFLDNMTIETPRELTDIVDQVYLELENRLKIERYKMGIF
ncbi:MAG: hypothetical protein LBJ83_01970, partial [Oscillospiraceae bacterium]|nr:hypothetical protein [Oscillospiraceae bacterium]